VARISAALAINSAIVVILFPVPVFTGSEDEHATSLLRVRYSTTTPRDRNSDFHLARLDTICWSSWFPNLLVTFVGFSPKI